MAKTAIRKPGKKATDGSWSERRDGMRIDWDVPIGMEDGTVLRADVYRPPKTGKYPVILTMGPYGKGLAWQDEVYATTWELFSGAHPDAIAGSTNKYQNWETVDPEQWVPDGYACVRVDSRGAGRSPGFMD
ncbi:MAG: CocE/NonD family hydrolase, partial [Alphaproteobacteria bacterium]